MFSPPAGDLIEAGEGFGVGQVAPDAELFQAVERLLGLRERQQHSAVVADVDEVVRGERVTRFDGLERRLALGAEAEDDSGRNGILTGAVAGSDRKSAEGQAFQPFRVFPDEPREVDSKVREREVGDGNSALKGLQGR